VAVAQDTARNNIPTGPLLRKPTVQWKQTPEDILIWINIPDLTQYSLNIKEDLPQQRLSFQSLVPDGYGFELDLLGKVLPPIEETPSGQYLILKIKKLSARFRWPYLVMGNPKFHWLKQKLDEGTLTGKKTKGYVSDEQEPSDSNEMNCRGNDPYCPVDLSDSDSDEEIEFSDDLLSDEDEESGAAC